LSLGSIASDLYSEWVGNGSPGPTAFNSSRKRASVVSDEPPNAFFKVENTNHLRIAICASASSPFDDVSNAWLPRHIKYNAIGNNTKGATMFFELKPKREISRTVVARASLMFFQLF